VIDRRDEGYPLAGARIDVNAGNSVATLVFTAACSISLVERLGSAVPAPLIALYCIEA
jgi:hypothetical protein